MKIGYFTHSNISPSETFIYDLIKALNSEESIDLTVFGGNRLHQINGIENLDIVSTGYAQNGYQNSFKLYKFGQILGNKGNLFKNIYQQRNAYRALKSTIKQNKAPTIAYIEYGTSAVLCYKYLLDNNIPFLVHVHGYDVTSALKDNYYKTQLQQVFKYAKHIIAASHYIRKILILAGCAEDKIKVIRLGVASHNIVPCCWSERLKQNPSIAYLGRLTAKKHPIALLYAFRIIQQTIPNVMLTIIGGGELEDEVKKCISDLNLSGNVRMLGVLNRDQAFPILNQHWVYAQHSVTANSGDQEGFAVSLAEAALHEIPVVSTFHNGIPENVIDGKTGFLVQEYDFETMAQKIVFLLQNPTIAEQMGKAGRQHIMELCEPRKRVRLIKELLLNSVDE